MELGTWKGTNTAHTSKGVIILAGEGNVLINNCRAMGKWKSIFSTRTWAPREAGVMSYSSLWPHCPDSASKGKVLSKCLLHKLSKDTHQCYRSLQGGVALSAQRPGEASITVYLRNELILKNWAVRPGRNKRINQGPACLKAGMHERPHYSRNAKGLLGYKADNTLMRQDARLMSSGSGQKGLVGHAWMSELLWETLQEF